MDFPIEARPDTRVFWMNDENASSEQIQAEVAAEMEQHAGWFAEQVIETIGNGALNHLLTLRNKGEITDLRYVGMMAPMRLNERYMPAEDEHTILLGTDDDGIAYEVIPPTIDDIDQRQGIQQAKAGLFFNHRGRRIRIQSDAPASPFKQTDIHFEFDGSTEDVADTSDLSQLLRGIILASDSDTNWDLNAAEIKLIPAFEIFALRVNRERIKQKGGIGIVIARPLPGVENYKGMDFQIPQELQDLIDQRITDLSESETSQFQNYDQPIPGD